MHDQNTTHTGAVPPVHVLYWQLATEDVKPAKKRKGSWDPGTCSVCGTDTDVMRAGALLGLTFGSWQEVSRYNSVTALCKPCAWGFKNKQVIYSPSIVTPDDARLVTWREVGEYLLDHDVDADVSVIAPTSGRKIVAPYAQYGKVTTDHGGITWSSKYRLALKACFQLNRVNIRGGLLSEPSPPYGPLSELSPEKHKAVHEMWRYLSFVRDDKTLLALFTKISMNLKEALPQ